VSTVDHESHERFEDECPECVAEREADVARYRPATQAMSRDERQEMEADRELMRDEFHQ
jgi:hypothetical protein